MSRCIGELFAFVVNGIPFTHQGEMLNIQDANDSSITFQTKIVQRQYRNTKTRHNSLFNCLYTTKFHIRFGLKTMLCK